MKAYSGGEAAPETHRPTLSFIIPAYNEVTLIGATVDEIHALVGGEYPYEVIVVDHGSDDGTPQVAASRGAQVHVHPSGTVAGLRNQGARLARGDIFVFLDADVLLTRAWIARLPAAVDLLRMRPRVLTGSWCGISGDPSTIERFWFAPLLRATNTHINSGHLITTRAFFEEIGGFDESLETGEDYELSMRAVARGGGIVEDPMLDVEHRGYPRTVQEFFRRELWHGRSDFASARAFFRSKIAIAAVAFLLLHGVVVVGIATRVRILAGAAAALIVLLCLSAAVAKYRSQPVRTILVNAGLYYVYFLARGLAFLRLAESRSRHRHAARAS